jgi:hypothetical protein
MKVKNNNSMLPAISLPLKFVDPIRMAINSLPSILNINSKLFSVMLTATGFSVSVIFFIHFNAETIRIRIVKPVFRYRYVTVRKPFVGRVYSSFHLNRVSYNDTEHDYAANCQELLASKPIHLLHSA